MRNITDQAPESSYLDSTYAYLRSAHHYIAEAERALQMLESILRKQDPRQMLLFDQSEGEEDLHG